LRLGLWWPWSLGEDATFVTPPGEFELTFQRATEGFAKGQLVIRQNPSGDRSWRISYWTLTGTNEAATPYCARYRTANRLRRTSLRSQPIVAALLDPFPSQPDGYGLGRIPLAIRESCGDNSFVSDVVQSVRQLLQDFIAPELRELKRDVSRLESKMDSGLAQVESKVDSGLAQLESKMGSGLAQLESKMDSGFAQMRSLIENPNLRAELEATRDIANLRESVTRLEVERGINRQ
jgi:hypothetical protein